MKIKNQLWLQLLFSVVSLAFLIFVSWAFYALMQHWDVISSRITIASSAKDSNRYAVAGAAQAVGALFQGTFGVAVSLIGAIAAIFLGYASLKTAKTALIVSAQAERRENQRYATESLEQALKPFFMLSSDFVQFNDNLDSKLKSIWATAKVAAAEYVVVSRGIPVAEQDGRILRLLAHPRVAFPHWVIDEIARQTKEVNGKKYDTRVASWLATSEIAKSCSDICQSLDAAIIPGLDEAARNLYSNWLAWCSKGPKSDINFSDVVSSLRSARTGTSLQELAVDFVARSVREASFYCQSTTEKAGGVAHLIAELGSRPEFSDYSAGGIEFTFLGKFGKGYIVRYLLEQRDDAGSFENFMRQLPNEAGTKTFMSEMVAYSPGIERVCGSFHQHFVKQFDDSFWQAWMTYNQQPLTRCKAGGSGEAEAQRFAAFLLYQTPDTRDCIEELLHATEEPQLN
ncbi:hypothetical protein [Paraburkholderia dipogonis]|uniref:hypothetical protein n=1 Tax=Paraburkholderia dipogonis TaxID=1211383 RepID=UPI0038BA4862